MKKHYVAFLFGSLMLLAFLAEAQNIQLVSLRSPQINNRLVKFGHRKGDESRKVDVVIVHSTYYANSSDSFSINGVIQQFESYGVSAHYVIDRDGKIHQLVDEKDISYHAGKGSLPDGRSNINLCSIGIEIVNTTANGPNAKQYESLALLVRDIKQRYQIKYVLGHSDIAPDRKTDPWKFDWKKFRSMID